MKSLTTTALSIFSIAVASTVTGHSALAATPDADVKEFEQIFGKGPQEEDVYRTDRLLLTATGSLKPVHLAPSVASVITAEDIKDIGATTLDEVLETVPGLHVAPSNKNQMNPVYSIRGIHSSLNPHVLVMIDGLPVTYAYTGARPFGFSLPVSMISRIEVVRGPGSAVHGADAFAGTINVITKDGYEINGSKAGVRYGSFDSGDIWLQHGKQYGGWDVSVGLDYMQGKGDDNRVIKNDLQSTLDKVLGTNATLTPGALNTEYKILNANVGLAKGAWTIRFWGWLLDDGGVADGVTQTLAPESYTDSHEYRADLNYHNTTLLKDTTFDTRCYYASVKVAPYFQLFPAGAMLPIGSDGNIDFATPAGITYFPDGVFGNPPLEEDHAGIEQIMLYEGIRKHQIRAAVGLKYLQAEASEKKNFGPGILNGSQVVSSGFLTDITDTSYIYMEKQDRTLGYVSLQDTWAFAKNWELTAGVRYDDYSDFGSTINPRAALVWETRYDLTTKLMYGRAFRAPALVELYAKNNPSNLGNENLSPETIDTYELAFDFQPTTRLRTIFSVFYYEIDNLIELVQDPGQTTMTAQNHRSQKGSGGEIEVRWEVNSDLLLKGNLAYQRAKDSDTDDLIADAPEFQAYLEANWEFMPDWFLNGQYLWIGNRHRIDGDTRDNIKDYDLVNLTIRKKNILKQWDVALSAKNIFDEDIREPSQSVIYDDYPMEGRAVWGEVIWHF